MSFPSYRGPAGRCERTGAFEAACILMLVAAPGLGGAQPLPKVHTIIIDAMQYAPPSLEVRAGDRITWKNSDPFPHTVTAESRNFDSKEIAHARSWTWTPKKPGVYPYICTLHPGMKGVVIVK